MSPFFLYSILWLINCNFIHINVVYIDNIADKVEREAAYRKFMSYKLVEVFLLDWRNVKFNGEDIPFSVERATDFLLGSEAFMSLFETAVDKVATAVDKRDEEIEKN